MITRRGVGSLRVQMGGPETRRPVPFAEASLPLPAEAGALTRGKEEKNGVLLPDRFCPALRLVRPYTGQSFIRKQHSCGVLSPRLVACYSSMSFMYFCDSFSTPSSVTRTPFSQRRPKSLS